LRALTAECRVLTAAPDAQTLCSRGPYRWEDFLNLEENDLRELIARFRDAV